MMLSKLTTLRGSYFAIGDALDFRMSLAYVQFVQTLVDILVFVAPFALYPKLGAFAAVLNGFIALFYRGLLELSKSFLDPFGNRRVSASGLSADIGIATLIGESNAGSLVWPLGAERLPFGPGGEAGGKDAQEATAAPSTAAPAESSEHASTAAAAAASTANEAATAP